MQNTAETETETETEKETELSLLALCGGPDVPCAVRRLKHNAGAALSDERHNTNLRRSAQHSA